MTSDSLAAYAQLRAFYKTERSDNVPSEPSKLSKLSELSNPSDPSKLHDAISFVINDSVIYTSVDAFLSQEAKQLFMEWEQLQERLTKEQNQLEQLRMQYMQVEETLQAELAPRILQLESDIVRLQERCWALPREIRQRESSKL